MQNLRSLLSPASRWASSLSLSLLVSMWTKAVLTAVRMGIPLVAFVLGLRTSLRFFSPDMLWLHVLVSALATMAMSLLVETRIMSRLGPHLAALEARFEPWQ